MWKRCTVEWYVRGERYTAHVEALSKAHAKRLISRPSAARKVVVRCADSAAFSGARGRRKKRR